MEPHCLGQLNDLIGGVARPRFSVEKEQHVAGSYPIGRYIAQVWVDNCVGGYFAFRASSLLDGPAEGDVPEYLSLSSETPEVLVANVRSGGMSHPVIQVKLGTDIVETDPVRIGAVLSAMGPDQLLLAYFSGALSLDHALSAPSHVNDSRLM